MDTKTTGTTKATKAKAPATPKHKIKLAQQAQSKEPPQDLQDKVQALRALVQCTDLLQTGTFQWSQRERLQASFNFLGHLYNQVLTEAVAHKDYHKVPELIEAKVKLEAANAKS